MLALAHWRRLKLRLKYLLLNGRLSLIDTERVIFRNNIGSGILKWANMYPYSKPFDPGKTSPYSE